MKSNWLVVMAVLVSGCHANHDSLAQFIQQLESNPVVPLTVDTGVSPSPVVDYKGHDFNSPFTLPIISPVQQTKQTVNRCPDEQASRDGVQLAQFPLEQLKLKGVMSRQGKRIALIEAPNGQLVSVSAGQYLSDTQARVLSLGVTALRLEESIHEGMRCGEKRISQLRLN